MNPTFHIDGGFPEDWTRIHTVDAHTAGEPLRIILGGFPEPPGDTILERRRYAREHFESYRRALMFEPRGHADMYGCLLMSPVTADGDAGVLFLHNEGYSTMCGHAVIALTKVGVELGLFELRGRDTEVRLDTPAGRVTAFAHLKEEGQREVESVSFRNVPSFVLAADQQVDVPGLGAVTYDLAYGGAFYAYVDATQLGVPVRPAETSRLVDVGMRIKRAVMESTDIVHPTGDPDLNFLYGTILVEPADGAHSRNVCVFAEGEVDRSPTGTGVSGRAAIHHARGELAPGHWIRIESILETPLEVRVAELTRVGDLPAVVPEVRGTAFVTGRHEFVIDPRDPLREGFLLR